MFDYSTSYKNITNGTLRLLSRHVRHDNFVTDIKNPACEMVQLTPYDQRCKYVKDTDECHDGVFLIDYANLYYCVFKPEKVYQVVFCMLFLFLLCVILFVFLGSASDGFFCPALKVLSKIMRLSENLAGVTLLAFGNCAPDLFTSIAGLQAEAREAFNDTIASCCFVQLVVTSAIILSKPFKLTPSSFLRDTLFLILACTLLDYSIISGNKITLAEAIVIFMLYVIYITVICLDQYFLVRAAKKMKKQQGDHVLASDSRLRALRSEAEIDILARKSQRKTILLDEEPPKIEKRTGLKGSNAGLFKQFGMTLFPVDLEKWRSSKPLGRILTVFRFPINLVLTILLPVVDYEEDLHGWSKLLNVLQIMYIPPLVVYGFTMDVGIKILGVPLGAWFFVATIPLGIVVFIMSRTDIQPRFHKYFSILSVFGSIFVVYGGASELIQILKIIGFISYRSNSFLGCTLLAWGNSVGDLIANTAMARQGYQRMGLAACTGGPLFNILFTVGMIFIYRAAREPELAFTTGTGTLGLNSNIFMIFGMTVFLLGAVSTNFEMRRSIAVFPLTMYCLYLIYCLLAEFELVHPYGSDHRMDQRAEPSDF